MQKKVNNTTKYYQICYDIDINEIIVRTGNLDKKEKNGRFYISYGFQDKEADIEFEKRISNKLKEGWKKLIPHPLEEDELIDLRLELYDYEGKRKK
tara:strand:+ start:639 stop:926 length:288 start_codon:yes stop_codon:yes gene_type:complete